MQDTGYGLKITLPLPYNATVARTTEVLKEHGFGILTTIDVQQTMKEKLDRTFREYVILGACNPPLAHRALEADLDMGLLLPCNIIVYQTSPEASVVAAMAPRAALGIVSDSPELVDVAYEADRRLREALSQLEASAGEPVRSGA